MDLLCAIIDFYLATSLAYPRKTLESAIWLSGLYLCKVALFQHENAGFCKKRLKVSKE